MTAKQKAEFIKVFNQCTINFANDITEWGEIELEVMSKADFRTFDHPDDFNDFAKQSFLHAVKRYYDEHYDIEAALQGVKSIIRNSNED